MNREELLATVKRAVLDVEPESQVILFGSRARGDARPDSDWDFLILLRDKPTWRRVQEVRHRLYDIEWEAGEVLSSIVHGREEWNEPPLRFRPLRTAIDREGIAV